MISLQPLGKTHAADPQSWSNRERTDSNFTGCKLEERVALKLLELSENFGVGDGGVRLTVPATHNELVGASRPRVTESLISLNAST
jgi:hypothetical protein